MRKLGVGGVGRWGGGGRGYLEVWMYSPAQASGGGD